MRVILISFLSQTIMSSQFRTRLTPIAAAAHLIAAAAFAAASGAAFAQATPETLKEVTVTATSDVQYDVKATSTATKTDTLLRDTPQAITVVTKELMRDQNMQNMADVVRYVPGVQIAQGEGNRDTAVFRGNSSTSDFFVDGIRDDVQYYRDFYNIDSVEALKGSNAMIFGRGGSGGVINRVTKQPLWTPVREASVTLGSFDMRRATVDVGQAISANAAFRVNAMVENSDSYRNGVYVERKGINPTLAFRLGSNTSAVVGYEYFHDERVADRGVPALRNRPYKTDDSIFFGSAELSPTYARVHAFTAVLDHDFGNGFTLRNRTRVADYDKFYQNIFANSDARPATGDVLLAAYNTDTQRKNYFNQTDLFFRATTGSIKHTFVAGLELGRQETTNLRQTGTLSNAAVPLADPTFRGVATFARRPYNPARPNDAFDAWNEGVADVVSVYLQDQIEFSPQWQLIAGLRADRFEVDLDNLANNTNTKVKDTPVSPRLGLVYKPFEALSLYGSYSEAYMPRAGEQLASLTASIAAFEPEKFVNMELGAKWDIRPDLTATAAIYKLNRSNVLLSNFPTFGEFLLIEGDAQTSKGLELGLSGKITPTWSVFGGYAYQSAQLIREGNSSVLNGARLAHVPKHSWSLWNRFDLDSHWAAGLGVSRRGDIYASIANPTVLPGYTRVDTALYYKFNNQYQIQANIENLLNKEYYASAHSNNNIMPGSPRAVRVTLNAKF